MEPGLYPRLAPKARLETDPVTGGKALLYPEGVLTLNASAAEILECCDGRRSLGQIIDLLVRRHGIEGKDIAKDVMDCLSRLSSKGLVEALKEAVTQVPETVHSDASEKAFDSLAYRPFGLLAELTYACPLHCPYCSNPPSLPGKKPELTTEDWKRVLKEARELGVLHVLFSGGEPLQRPDLEELIQNARENGLYTNLITSALGFSKERAQALKRAGLDSIQISFQAAEAPLADRIAGTKAHRHKLEAAGIARETDLPLTLNVVLHRANIDRLEEVADLAERLGAHRLELANTQYYGWAFKNRAFLLPSREQVERAGRRAAGIRARLKGKMEVLYVLPDYYGTRPKPCMNGWGRRYLTVNPTGDVLPCPTSGGIQSLRFDNVREKSLAWIWRESESFNRFRGTEWMPEPCRSCDQREFDFGGCRCQAALLTGDAAHTDPACDLSPYRDRLTQWVGAAQGENAPESPSYQYRTSPSRESL